MDCSAALKLLPTTMRLSLSRVINLALLWSKMYDLRDHSYWTILHKVAHKIVFLGRKWWPSWKRGTHLDFYAANGFYQKNYPQGVFVPILVLLSKFSSFICHISSYNT